MEVFYKSDKVFHIRLKILENATAVSAKATFSDLQALEKTELTDMIT